MEEVGGISKKTFVLLLVIILTLFGFSIYVQQVSGGGTVTVLGASARIDNYNKMFSNFQKAKVIIS